MTSIHSELVFLRVLPFQNEVTFRVWAALILQPLVFAIKGWVTMYTHLGSDVKTLPDPPQSPLKR